MVYRTSKGIRLMRLTVPPGAILFLPLDADPEMTSGCRMQAAITRAHLCCRQPFMKRVVHI